MSSYRWTASILFLLGFVLVVVAQQGQPTPSMGSGAAPARSSDMELVERLVVLRKNYQQTLEKLRFFYLQAGDQERAKMAEEELIAYHRSRRNAFIEDLDVPPPTLQGNTNITDANNLLTRALQHKDKGWGTDYIDNQRRTEILLQELLTKYPQSDKISVAAYWLGDVYESKANQMYRRAAWYYTRCYQWNPANNLDARLRSAKIYDVQLTDRTKALEIYRDIITKEHVPAHRAYAEKRIAELSGKR